MRGKHGQRGAAYLPESLTTLKVYHSRASPLSESHTRAKVPECIGGSPTEIIGAQNLRVHQLPHALDANLFLALPGLSDVVRRLHTHQGIHLYAKRFSIRSAMSPERSALSLSRLDNAGRDTLSAAAAAVTDKPAGSIISVRIKLPGCGGFFMGMAAYPFS